MFSQYSICTYVNMPAIRTTLMVGKERDVPELEHMESKAAVMIFSPVAKKSTATQRYSCTTSNGINALANLLTFFDCTHYYDVLITKVLVGYVRILGPNGASGPSFLLYIDVYAVILHSTKISWVQRGRNNAREDLSNFRCL